MHSKASFTSCVLKILAPFMSEIVCNTDDPFSALSGVIFKVLYIMDFLEIPMIMGI